MAESIKFTDKYIDTTGVYDSTLNKTQQVINSKLVTVDTSSSSIGTPNPVNADTLGGYALSNFVRTSQLVNNFTTATAGLYALDAAAGKTLNDSLSNLSTSVSGINTNLTNFMQNLNGIYAHNYALGNKAGIQLRQTLDNQQAWLIFGVAASTKTILTVVSRYRQNSSIDPITNMTSLGQTTTTMSLSAGSEKYVQVGNLQYFCGVIISNSNFSAYSF